MTIEEWQSVAALLVAGYPRQAVPAETLAAYFHRLHRFDAAAVRTAVERALDECRFFPTIAELRERIGSGQSDQQRAEYARYDTSRMLSEPVVPASVAKKKIRRILTDLGAKKSMPTSDRDEEHRKRAAADQMIREESV